MIKILKYILFGTVLIIITLHASIPHPHSDELTEEEHNELHKHSDSFFGIIRVVFHEIDDENLDNLFFTPFKIVKKTGSKHRDRKVFTFKSTNSILELTATTKPVRRNTNNFDKLFFAKLNRLRGPPLFA